MRTEKEMFGLILNVARNDDRIRAVYMNGSRANPNVPKDIFQDYDIVYAVKETATFLQDNNWIRVFGEMLMVQQPDQLDKVIGLNVDYERSYAYLMLFTDGNRIDLRLLSLDALPGEYGKDKLTIPLLDKNHILPPISAPIDSDYYIQKPTKGEFDSCTSDFWWCLQNVAKGIWRDELPYAKLMFEQSTRNCLDKMVNWWIGTEEGFQVSSGKMGKYFKNYLPEQYWKMYKETYSNAEYEQMWNSIFVACELFRTLSQHVASKFDFSYPDKDDRNMTAFLQHIKELPIDAKEIY